MGVKLTGVSNVAGAVLFGEAGFSEEPVELAIFWDNGDTAKSTGFMWNDEASEQLVVQDQFGNPIDVPAFSILSGDLPEGLIMNAEGLISGVPVNQDETTTVQIEVVSGSTIAVLTLQVQIFWVG